MPARPDLTDAEAGWLARLDFALGLGMPREIEAKLLRLGLAHLAEVGMKVSAEGEALLKSRAGKMPARLLGR